MYLSASAAVCASWGAITNVWTSPFTLLYSNDPSDNPFRQGMAKWLKCNVTPTTLWLLLIASKRFVTVIHMQVPEGHKNYGPITQTIPRLIGLLRSSIAVISRLVSESERQRARNVTSESERDFSRERATIHMSKSKRAKLERHDFYRTLHFRAQRGIGIAWRL